MIGRAVILFILAAALVAGAGLYYAQVYAYYDRVGPPAGGVVLLPRDGGPAREIPAEGFEAIDAASSPLRYRDCFTTAGTPEALAGEFRVVEDPEPRVGPRWFSCFDADEIGDALAAGEATAFLSAENVTYGVDRVTAVFRDGRARSWHAINRCGARVFDGDPPPEGCPTPPADTPSDTPPAETGSD